MQRLEFLGDAVLDYILTDHFYRKYYSNCTPALLTNLRKASVNNCCYAHAAVKAGLHKHILHSSSKQMINDLENSGRSFSGPSHGWELGIGLPEVCLFECSIFLGFFKNIELIQNYFSAMEQYFLLTTFQHKPNFSISEQSDVSCISRPMKTRALFCLR